MKYEIRTITDTYDCDDCGTSWAEGFEIVKDGKVIHTKRPVAYCYNTLEYTVEQALAWILEQAQIEVSIDGKQLKSDEESEHNDTP